MRQRYLRVSVQREEKDVCVLEQEDCDSQQCYSPVRQLALEPGTKHPRHKRCPSLMFSLLCDSNSSKAHVVASPLNVHVSELKNTDSQTYVHLLFRLGCPYIHMHMLVCTLYACELHESTKNRDGSLRVVKMDS